jgi:hypothetical protein
VRVPSTSLQVVVFLVLCIQSFGQSVPPGAPVRRNVNDSSGIIAPIAPGIQSTSRAARTHPVELQREAKQILELSRSVQLDMDAVNRGLLPKDTIEKLKRIEKLSKHLRSQVGR